MTIYQTADVWTQIRESKAIPPKAIAYFQARLKNRLHELVLIEFMKLEKRGFTKADMARRIHKKPEQITRLLGAPGNWTLDTVSDLLLAMNLELRALVKEFDEAEHGALKSVEWQPTGRPNLRLVPSTTAPSPEFAPAVTG
jgi:DNA-binding phage protein